MSNQLAIREFVIELFPGFRANIRPREVQDKIFAEINVTTPFGPLSLLLSMQTVVFESMLNAARANNTHLKLWTFLRDQMGWMPRMYSVGERDIVDR